MQLRRVNSFCSNFVGIIFLESSSRQNQWGFFVVVLKAEVIWQLASKFIASHACRAAVCWDFISFRIAEKFFRLWLSIKEAAPWVLNIEHKAEASSASTRLHSPLKNKLWLSSFLHFCLEIYASFGFSVAASHKVTERLWCIRPVLYWWFVFK